MEEMSVMKVKYLLRRRGNLLTLLIVFTLILVILNLYFTHSLNDKRDNCNIPCFGTTCPRVCETQSSGFKQPSVDVIRLLRLNLASPSTNASMSPGEVLCKRPSYNLQHDSVKNAFFPMKALNCSRTELFEAQHGVIVMDKRKIPADREILKCVYYGIQRVNDDFHTLTEPHIKETGPFSLIIKEDFVRIKCYLKPLEEANSAEIKVKSGTAERKDVPTKLNITNHPQNRSNPGDFGAQNDEINVLKIQREFSNNTNTKGQLHELTRNVNAMNQGVINDDRQKGKNSSSILSQIKYIPRVEGAAINKSESHVKTMLDDALIFNNDANVNLKNYPNQKNKKIHHRKLLQHEYGDDDDTNYAEHMQGDPYMYDMYPFIDEPVPDYDQLLVQVYPREDVHQRISKLLQQRESSSPQMNVLMLGLDSMSHLSYQRKLPKTYQYLKQELGAVILNGYNIVGDATTAALIPMLTGYFETELPEVRRNRFDSEYVDVFPLIWKQFRDNGYVTLFAEDEPTIGAFNLRLNGFEHPPTDHYMRPFWQALWDSEVHEKSPKFCTGNVPNHMYLLNYAKDFFVKYSNVSKFAFVFGSELTHWDNNPGEYMDQDIVSFLQFLKTEGHLDNTMLIVMGDHGARYSRVRKTVQGKIEERLPLMSITMPTKFRKKFHRMFKNLKDNGDRLATPFDIHETLLEILRLNQTNATPHITNNTKGISLFKKIPANRTCAAASIQTHWCTCLQEYPLSLSDRHVRKAAHALVQFINKGTAKVRSLCSVLRVKKILHAFLVVPNEQVLMFQKTQDADQRIANFSENINLDHTHFQITMETSPNRGFYEGTVQVNTTAGSFTVMEQDISRIDMYGNQPACVQEKYPDLRKYCYCYNSTKSG